MTFAVSALFGLGVLLVLSGIDDTRLADEIRKILGGQAVSTGSQSQTEQTPSPSNAGPPLG